MMSFPQEISRILRIMSRNLYYGQFNWSLLANQVDDWFKNVVSLSFP